MFRCLVHPEFSAFRWRRRSFCGYFAVKQLAFFTLSKFIEPRTAQPTASLAAGHRAKPARKKTSSKQPVIPTAVGSRILPVKPLIPASPKARQRHGLGERARPRVHQHAPPRAELKNMRPQAGGIFDMSGARRPRRQARSPGPFNSSSVSFPRHRHGSAAPSSPFDSLVPTSSHPSDCLAAVYRAAAQPPGASHPPRRSVVVQKCFNHSRRSPKIPSLCG